MSSYTMSSLNGAQSVDLGTKPEVCPYCHRSIDAIFQFAHACGNPADNVKACPNERCNEWFIAEYFYTNNHGVFKRVIGGTPKATDFGNDIKGLPPKFVEIFNEANQAEMLGLLQILGSGYRKALEFLIKDYAISKQPDKEEEIKKAFISNVIKDYISDQRIKDKTNTRKLWKVTCSKFDQVDLLTSLFSSEK